jgi:hypothetical protein
MHAAFISMNLAVQAINMYLGHIGGKLAFHTPAAHC